MSSTKARKAPSRVALAAAAMIYARDLAGQEKYGTSMDREDLKPGDWLQHAIEEHADALNYQIKLKRELVGMVLAAFDAGVAAERANDRTEGTRRAVVHDLLGGVGHAV